MDEHLPEEKQVYANVLEALLFASDAPLSVARIREVMADMTPRDIKLAVSYLNDQYRQMGRSFEIREIAGGLQMFTLPEYASYVEKMFQSRQQSRLSQKALETLAIIVYKQPITRHEIEEIRGVNVDGVTKTLLSRNLITISGRAKAPGSPFLYVTTRKFLEYFGLNSLDDLPKLKEIDQLIDLDEEGIPQHETLLREIDITELGLQSDGKENTREEKPSGPPEDQA